MPLVSQGEAFVKHVLERLCTKAANIVNPKNFLASPASTLAAQEVRCFLEGEWIKGGQGEQTFDFEAHPRACRKLRRGEVLPILVESLHGFSARFFCTSEQRPPTEMMVPGKATSIENSAAQAECDT